MSTKRKIGYLSAILVVLIAPLLRYCLLAQILKAINASTALWLLYCVYVIADVISAVLRSLPEP